MPVIATKHSWGPRVLAKPLPWPMSLPSGSNQPLFWPTTKPLPPNFVTNCGSSSRIMPSSISSATTTTISPKPTYRPPTPTLPKPLQSTTKLICCGIRPPVHCLNDVMSLSLPRSVAFMVLAFPKPTSMRRSPLLSVKVSTNASFCANWPVFNTSAMISN